MFCAVCCGMRLHDVEFDRNSILGFPEFPMHIELAPSIQLFCFFFCAPFFQRQGIKCHDKMSLSLAENRFIFFFFVHCMTSIDLPFFKEFFMRQQNVCSNIHMLCALCNMHAFQSKRESITIDCPLCSCSFARSFNAYYIFLLQHECSNAFPSSNV